MNLEDELLCEFPKFESGLWKAGTEVKKCFDTPTLVHCGWHARGNNWLSVHALLQTDVQPYILRHCGLMRFLEVLYSAVVGRLLRFLTAP